MAENEIERLIYLFAKLPGLGKRSARRVVLHLLKNKELHLNPLEDALRAASEKIQTCIDCGNLDVTNPCTICQDNTRDPEVVCVVETVGDLWVLERSKVFKGRYHVLGGVLSALEGKGPNDLHIDELEKRIANGVVREVIMATNATVEGQTTSHYISERLGKYNIKISRLAHGIPVGGELDYIDDGTLAAALMARSLV